ncbi:hypothetical protein [Streptomyces anulatus]|uniref:hypothetical protein n=1 Tax=Streptomyces anulatus TaxID=1892 RepID=UPI0036360493
MRWLTVLLVYEALLQALVIGPHMIAGPLLADGAYGGAAGWAVIGEAQAVGSIAGGVPALRWRPRQPLAAACAVGVLMAPYLGVLALGVPLWMVCVLAVLTGAGVSEWEACSSTSRTTTTANGSAVCAAVILQGAPPWCCMARAPAARSDCFRW